MRLKKNLKKSLSLALGTALLFEGANLPIAAISAAAEQTTDLQILGSISPSTLAAPGEVQLSLRIENSSGHSLHALNLSTPDGQIIPVADDLEADSFIEITCTYPVSQDELDAGAISCLLTGEDGNETFSDALSISILKEQIVPEVEFLRRISNDSVAENDTATIVYLIRNTGNVAVHSIVVTDSLGEYVGEIESLDVNENVSLINRAIITEDAVSAPTLEYSVGNEDENRYTARLDEATIRIAHSALGVSLTAARSVFSTDSSEVVLTLTNNGDADYHNIIIRDDLYGGVIAEGLSLLAEDAPLQIVKSYPLRETSRYRWRIQCSTSTGEFLDFVTNEVDVAADSSNDVLLTLTADVSKPRINRKGYVTFTLSVSNLGSGIATNVQISEANKGNVTELVVVPCGEPTNVTVRYDIREDSEYTFSATYLDENGQQHTATAEPISVKIVSNGEKPEERYVTEELTKEHPLVQSKLFLGLLIGSCALLVTLCIVLLIASLRDRKERKERDAARKQKLREELGKTNRFTPLKQSMNKKK